MHGLHPDAQVFSVGAGGIVGTPPCTPRNKSPARCRTTSLLNFTRFVRFMFMLLGPGLAMFIGPRHRTF